MCRRPGPDGTPLQYIPVTLTGIPFTFPSLNSTGPVVQDPVLGAYNYSFHNVLPRSTYRVLVQGSSAGYLDQWFNAKPNEATANLIDLTQASLGYSSRTFRADFTLTR